jgi:general secretion pathway protein C
MANAENLLRTLFPPEPSSTYLVARNLVLIALCVFLLVRAASSWARYRLEPLTVVSPSAAERVSGKTGRHASQDRGPPDTGIVVQRNIFGGKAESGQDKQKQSISLDNIPLAEKISDLKLIGTIVGNGDYRLAIIENTRKRSQDFYREGERLKEARIKRILRNNVVVTLNGQDKVLSIDYKTRKRLQGTSSSGGTPGESARTVSLDRDYVLSSLSNVQSIMRSARIMPYMRDGETVGFRVNNLKQGGFFDKLNLENGDVVLSANGEKLLSPEQVMQMATDIRNQEQVSLKIRRGGRTVTMKYNLQ